MMLRSCWIVLALLGGRGAAHAQQATEAPPVPPETENALRGRATPAADGGKGGATFAPNPPPGGSLPLGGDASAPAAAGDPLRAFPPAPPPTAPGPPQQPTAALTSFAPAPEPPPGGAPAASAASAAPAGAAEPRTANTVSPAGAPAAVSGEHANEAPAAYSPDDTRWSAAALAGVGVTFDNTVAGVNPLGFGFGVHADYRLLPKWSLGARVLYFVGGSVELPTSDVAMQSWLIAAEAAYVIEADHILIQPGLALGLHVRETDYRGFAGLTGAPEMLIPPDRVRFGFYVAPGVNVAVPLGLASPSLAPLIVGADVRLDMAFGKGVTSNVQLLVLAGFQF